jgi:hypothetical protein
MNSPRNIRSADRGQVNNEPQATMTLTIIELQPAGSSTSNEPRSHPGITIKWSLDSVRRRSADAPCGTRQVGVGGGVLDV